MTSSRSAHAAGIAGRGDRVDGVRLPVRRRRRAGAGRPDRRPSASTRGADRLSFGDTTGMATPRRVDDLLDALEHGRHRRATAIGLHFHDTRGTALANVVAALDRGRHAVRRVDRRSRRLPLRARGVGQRGDGGSRAHARRHGDRDRHRPRRADRLRATRAGDRRSRAPERAAARRHAHSDGTRRERRRTDVASTTERALGRATSRRTPRSSRGRTSCSCATGSRCCSTPTRSSRTRCSPTRSPAISRPTAWSPASAAIDGRPVCVMANDSDGEGRLVGRAHRREDRAAHRVRAARTSCRSSTSSTPPARASPTRSSCSRAGAARAGSSPTRCGSRARCRRCAACSGRRPRAARTSRRSATSCSWSRATRRCTSARPRMAEVVIGENVDARGDGRRAHARDRQRLRRQPLRVRRGRDRAGPALPVVPADDLARCRRPSTEPRPRRRRAADRGRSCRVEERRAYDMHKVIDALVDDGIVLRAEAAVGARAHHRVRRGSTGVPVGIVANNPMHSGACCSSTRPTRRRASSGCATRSTSRCVFLADVPGFMIGSQVERQGIIRHGAKMITAVAEATVPEVLGHRAQGVRRGPVRDVRPGVRSRRVPRAADRADRGDGPRAGGQRGVLQPDPRDRGPRRARRVRGRAARASTRRTSTSCTSPPSSSSTRWCSPRICGAELIRRLALAASRVRDDAAKRHGVPPV